MAFNVEIGVPMRSPLPPLESRPEPGDGLTERIANIFSVFHRENEGRYYNNFDFDALLESHRILLSEERSILRGDTDYSGFNDNQIIDRINEILQIEGYWAPNRYA